jgi:N utilization substance protein A
MVDVDRTLTSESLRHISLFEEVTGVEVMDCVDEDERLVFVVDDEELGKAIGRDAHNLENLRDKTNKDVEIVGYLEDQEDFVRNLFHKVTLEEVRIEANDDGEAIAYVVPEEESKGRAIGEGGRNVDMARELASRHTDLDDIKVE